MNDPQRIFYGSVESGTIWDSKQQAEGYHFQARYFDFPIIELVERTPLIASAPDLVAVLASCITEDAQGIVDRGNGAQRLDHITRLARYAINLATGQ